jgi:hypothetical protein
MVSVGRHPLSTQHILGALLVATGLLGCSRAPAEPERDPAPAAAESAAPLVTPLTWEVPGSWTVLTGPRSGPRKAGYKPPKAGDDKEDAEVSVLFFGTGALGDPDKSFNEWFSEFDGDLGKTAKRESFEVRGMKVETVEVVGTYKIALGPKVGPKKKAPMQMVKEGWRLVGAVVKTPDRGNWFFKMVGPDETVQSARSGFRSMLDSAK